MRCGDFLVEKMEGKRIILEGIDIPLIIYEPAMLFRRVGKHIWFK